MNILTKKQSFAMTLIFSLSTYTGANVRHFFLSYLKKMSQITVPLPLLVMMSRLIANICHLIIYILSFIIAYANILSAAYWFF